jgi:hypothetical protein
MPRLLVAALVLAAACGRGPDTRALTTSSVNTLAFHGDGPRLGWNAREATLTPAVVGGGRFGLLWQSPALDEVTIASRRYGPHLYASPLYVDGVTLADPALADARPGVVFVATSNGYAYAVGASPSAAGPAGAILWRTRLTTPAVAPHLDGGVPMGVLGTPIIDLRATPPRLYVASMDAARGWQVFALALDSGAVLPGWPVTLDDDALGAVNGNGPARQPEATAVSQRGALALSPAGDLLYVTFGTYWSEGVGFLVAVDTAAATVTRSFSSAPWSERHSSGGMWGAGGPAVDRDGSVWVTTGNSPPGSGPAPRTWGNSLLRFGPRLSLLGAYTPWNYCHLDDHNIDLGASAPLLLPPLDPALAGLVVFGGKQGNVYLVDRQALVTAAERPPCGADPAADRSLLPPEPQPHLGARGPLNVFGPYSEELGELDYAKMRTRLAYFRDGEGRSFLFAAGATKDGADASRSVPPSLVRLALVTPPGRPPHLAPAGSNGAVAFVNPGSPVVSSDGPTGPVVWVVDASAGRQASLLDPATPGPRLFAFDGVTLGALWASPPGALPIGGKYVTPVVAHGTVFVGADRLYAFGARP